MIYYDGRYFRPVSTQGASETTHETVFKYQQRDDMLTGTYAGGSVRFGHLIGLVDENGLITMRYHHINSDGSLMTGICHSTPEILDTGKIRLHERWQWTSGDKSSGESVLEEI